MNRLEQLRAFVEGTLPDAERDAFLREVEQNPELAEMLEAYRVFADATANDPVPESTTSFADVTRRTPSIRRRLTVAAVAAVALLAVAVSFWGRGSGDAVDTGPGVVSLQAVVLRSPQKGEVPEPVPPPPELAESYRPDDGETIDWLDDLDDALSIARYAGRPVLLFVDYPGCPLCAMYEHDVFPIGAVRDAADAFVMLRLTWNEAPAELRTDPSRGWPIFPVLDHAGKRIDGFSGYKTARPLERWIRAASKRIGKTGRFSPVAWKQVNSLAKRARAESLSYADLDALAQENPAGRFGAFARSRIQVLHNRAETALRDARDATPAEARRILEDARKELRETPYAHDLNAVLSSLGKTGAFPRLENAK